MSYWVSKMKCRKCGTEINVTGGMVQDKWMGPSNDQLKCLNATCDGWGYDNFIYADNRFEHLYCKNCGGVKENNKLFASHFCGKCKAFDSTPMEESLKMLPCPKCEICNECSCCTVHHVNDGGGHDFVMKKEPPTYPGRMA